MTKLQNFGTVSANMIFNTVIGETLMTKRYKDDRRGEYELLFYFIKYLCLGFMLLQNHLSEA